MSNAKEIRVENHRRRASTAVAFLTAKKNGAVDGEVTLDEEDVRSIIVALRDGCEVINVLWNSHPDHPGNQKRSL